MDPVKRPIRLAIANDYAVVIAGVASFFADERIDVVETGASLPVVSDVDIVLYDTFGQVTGDGLGLEDYVRDSGAKVVIYGWNLERDLIQRALAGGACGYLSKALTGPVIIDALERIVGGETVIMTGEHETSVGAEGDWPGRSAGLSPREAEVLALIALGLTNKDIAERAFVSANTVKTYIRSAYRKIGVERRTQAVRWALNNGFLPDTERTIDLALQQPPGTPCIETTELMAGLQTDQSSWEPTLWSSTTTRPDEDGDRTGLTRLSSFANALTPSTFTPPPLGGDATDAGPSSTSAGYSIPSTRVGFVDELAAPEASRLGTHAPVIAGEVTTLPGVTAGVTEMGLRAALHASRSLLSIEGPEDAAGVAQRLVADLGGWVVDAHTSGPHPVPVDVSFGHGSPRLPFAPVGSPAHALLETYLPGFVLDAHRSLELVDRSARLAEDASVDPLTGVHNKRAIGRVLGRLRDGDTVVMLDLDNFKSINDTLGHLVGDEVFRAFGAALRATVRATDRVGRYGGDEFVVVLSSTEPEPFLRRLKKEWESLRPHPVTFSGGYTGPGVPPTQALNAADKALYRAKDLGRDRWERTIEDDLL